MSKMPKGCRYPACACTYPDCNELPHQIRERRDAELREAWAAEYSRDGMSHNCTGANCTRAGCENQP